MRNVVECRSLCKVYKLGWWSNRHVHALRDINWSVQSGERWVILGPNRAGKSTLLRLIVSLLQPTSGYIYRFGESANKLATLARVGYVGENALLPPHWSVEGLVRWSGFLHGLRGTRLLQRVACTLEQFDLRPYAAARIRQLSRGIRQRVAIALAWCHQPELIVLDEPFDGLDASARGHLQEMLFSSSSPTVTYILATHQHAFACAWATHVLVLDNGIQRYCGPINHCGLDCTSLAVQNVKESERQFFQSKVPCDVS
jgi:ABC-2 type transport system ATP-binding protein